MGTLEDKVSGLPTYRLALLFQMTRVVWRSNLLERSSCTNGSRDLAVRRSRVDRMQLVALLRSASRIHTR
jgi:hypothetical protein